MRTFYEIIDIIMELEKFKFKTQVANILGLSKEGLHSAATRNSIPYDRIIDYATKNDISLDWLLKGVYEEPDPNDALLKENRELKSALKKIEQDIAAIGLASRRKPAADS